MTKRVLSLRSSETGSATVLIVVVLVLLSVVSLAFLSREASQDLDAELHRELDADKVLVRSSLEWNARCNQAIRRPCRLGDLITLYDKKGKVLVARSGDEKIGKWNVRMACDVEKVTLRRTFHVQVARKAGTRDFLEDPLTKNKLAWTSIFPARDFCEPGPRPSDLVLRNDCYGNESGRDPVTTDLLPFCPGCSTMPNIYCADDQIAFPSCPSGYRVGIRYIDRFGWGGIDLNKITVCKKL